jgi:hypothetical protein
MGDLPLWREGGGEAWRFDGGGEGVAILLFRPPLLQEAHHELIVGAAHKLGVAESANGKVSENFVYICHKR